MKTKGQVMQARSDQTTAQIELAKLRDQVSPRREPPWTP